MLNAHSQQVVNVDKFEGSAMNFFKAVGGEPISNTKFVRVVEGSPYYFDNWMKGSVQIGDKEYKPLLLRLNVLETTLEFKDQKGEMMICTEPVKRVVLVDTPSGVSNTFIHSSFLPPLAEVKNSWLLELANGKASLYKLTKKLINEVRPYGSATNEQHILPSYSYYLLQNNTLTRVKKTSDIIDLLPDKKSELQDFAKSNKLSNKWDDMTKLVFYYNTL